MTDPLYGFPPLVRRDQEFSQQRLADYLYLTRCMFDHAADLSTAFCGDEPQIRRIKDALGELQRGLIARLGEVREMDLIDDARKRFPVAL